MVIELKIYEEDQKIILEGVEDFHPKHTFECGQCFRWNQEEDGSYTGVAHKKVINIQTQGNNIIINNTNIDDFNTIWRSYFDLDRDYSAIKEKLSQDPILKKATEFGWGIRILNQDVWECLISFIISSNNQIPRIKKIIESICEKYGQPIEYNNKIYYSFPDPEDLKDEILEDLAFCRSGYRCGYILDAIRCVTEGMVNLGQLKDLSTADAEKELVKIKGVGPKVAHCILLFSAEKYDAFPIDVWVRRVMGHLYFGENMSIDQVKKFVANQYGHLAGFAQQYLFYYAREQKIGK